MAENPLINVHIEKTAGQSLRTALINEFGAEQVLIYKLTNDTVMRASDRLVRSESPNQKAGERLAGMRALYPFARLGLSALRQLEARSSFPPESMPDDFEALAGHFSASRFEDIIPPETARYVSVVRDPLDRIQSHYNHRMRTNGLAHIAGTTPFDRNMPFDEYAFIPEFQNAQTRALGFEVERYHRLGVIDHFPEFLEELGLLKRTGIVPRVNVGDYEDQAPTSRAFICRFEEFHRLDYELFNHVSEQWT